MSLDREVIKVKSDDVGIDFYVKSKIMVAKPKDGTAAYLILNLNGEYPAICRQGKKIHVSNDDSYEFFLTRSYNPNNTDGSVYSNVDGRVMKSDPIPAIFIKKYSGEKSLSNGIEVLQDSDIHVPESGIQIFNTDKKNVSKEDTVIDKLVDIANNLKENVLNERSVMKSLNLQIVDKELKVYGFVRRMDETGHLYYFSQDDKYCLEIFPDALARGSLANPKAFSVLSAVGFELINVEKDWKPVVYSDSIAASDNITSLLLSIIIRDLSDITATSLRLPKLDYFG